MSPDPEALISDNEITTRALGLFPDFFIKDLVANADFAQNLDMKPSFDVVLGPGIRILRAEFFTACSAALAESKSVQTVTDSNSRVYELTAEPIKNKPTLVCVTNKDVRIFVTDAWSLNPSHEARIRDFRRSLAEAGLPPSALASWRTVLADRPLDGNEVGLLNDELSQTHAKFLSNLESQFSAGSIKLSDLVPRDRRYWENFCGLIANPSIEDFAKTTTRQKILEHVASDTEKGARFSLLFSSHQSFMTDSPLVDLAPKDLLYLAKWAKDHGPILAKVGMIELGMQVLSKVPKLAPTLRTLITQILNLKPEDRHGQLHATMSLFVFVDGQMSQSGPFADMSPSLRRFGAFAHAGLIECATFGRIDFSEFGGTLLASAARQFYIQTLIDLREEPRWVPDFASADQLKDELVGRVSNVVSKHLSEIPNGSMRRLVEEKLLKIPASPRYFYPGPLEGRLPDAPVPLIPELEAIIDTSLQSDALTFENLMALLALGPMFTVGDEKIQRIVAMIRKGGHRVSGQIDFEKRDRVFAGFGQLACSSRNTQLAEELRRMMRKARRESADPPKAEHDFFIGLTAAAAYEETEAWARFVGDWGNELAFEIDDKDEAIQLRSSIEAACEIEPRLRYSLGRGLAAIDAFLGM
jgi:hypothetical protein